MSCPNCGGAMIGDGRQSVRHCENTLSYIWDLEPDAGPIYCNPEDEERDGSVDEPSPLGMAILFRDGQVHVRKADRACLSVLDQLLPDQNTLWSRILTLLKHQKGGK